MKIKKYKGTPYHLWNPFTAMEEFLSKIDVGPSVIHKGEGPYVFDGKGKQYINGFSSLWNVAIGHGRKELIEAATSQIQELAFASCFRQSHPRAIELAAKLIAISSGHFSRVYLGSNGSEAVETALKMARQYYRQSPESVDRGRFKIISLKGSYHGVSYGVLSTSGLEADSGKFGPLLPGFLQIPPPYCYRCPYDKASYPACGLACALALEKTIREEGPESVAAFIMEPIMGAYGIIVPPEEYYKAVGEICRRHNLLFIVDEVTTGFGRTGKLFTSQDWEIQPDILCLGKAISSGYLPLSATLATEKIFDRFLGKGNQFEHGSTASGHPVCAAVGLRNIDIIIQEKVPENAADIGRYLQNRIENFKDKHAIIGDIRGRGLMIGIELVKDRESKTPLSPEEAFDHVLDSAVMGLLTYNKGSIIGLFPPLIIDQSIADEIVRILDKALDTKSTAKVARKARLVKEFASSKLSKGERLNS
jgi:adenosylmethionine-8-amino-7-oxononanoate aminotransferase